MKPDKEIPHLVATFANVWEAELSHQCLADAGIPSWVEQAGLDNPYRLTVGGMGAVRLFVPIGRVDEARTLLDELASVEELAPLPDESDVNHRAGRLPLWVRVAGGILLVGLIVSAIPHGLRVPVALVALGVFFGWRRLRPDRTTGSPGDPSDDSKGPP